jgi:hypothetical protein
LAPGNRETISGVASGGRPRCRADSGALQCDDGAVNPSRILVVGDAMLDRYWDGFVDRISPEAPVPVLRVTRRYERPGGAANVAADLAALGAAVSLIALVGEDEAGSRLGSLMDDAGVAFDRVADPGYATIEKIRCVARHHQMLRADFEMAPPPAMRAGLAERFACALRVHDLVVLSATTRRARWPTAGPWCRPREPRASWRWSIRRDAIGLGPLCGCDVAQAQPGGAGRRAGRRGRRGRARAASHGAARAPRSAVLTHDELVDAFDATR